MLYVPDACCNEKVPCFATNGAFCEKVHTGGRGSRIGRRVQQALAEVSGAGLLVPELLGHLFDPGAPLDLGRDALELESAKGGAQQDGSVVGMGLPAEARCLVSSIWPGSL